MAARRKRAGHTQESLAEVLGVDTSTVRRWELGLSDPRPRQRGPLARALRVVLDELDELLRCRVVGGHAHLLAQPGSASLLDPLAVPGAESIDAAQRLVAGDADGFVLDRADWIDVEVVREVTAALACVENRVGGVPVVDRGMRHLRWAAQLLGSRPQPAAREALFEAVGNLAEVVGFCAFDRHDVRLAERCFHFAVRCADEAGSRSLRAAVLADLARVHAFAGNIGRALSTIGLAQATTDGVPPTARTILHVMRARYLVLDRRSDEALRQVDLADEEIARRDASTDPPWLLYYDLAEHDGSVGRALAPLAVATAKPELAAPRLEAAVRQQARGYPRSRVFSRIRLARLLVGAGDPDRALGPARTALDESAALTSRRVLDEFDDLLRLTRRTSASSLRELSADILDHMASKRTAPWMTPEEP